MGPNAKSRRRKDAKRTPQLPLQIFSTICVHHAQSLYVFLASWRPCVFALKMGFSPTESFRTRRGEGEQGNGFFHSFAEATAWDVQPKNHGKSSNSETPSTF